MRYWRRFLFVKIRNTIAHARGKLLWNFNIRDEDVIIDCSPTGGLLHSVMTRHLKRCAQSMRIASATSREQRE